MGKYSYVPGSLTHHTEYDSRQTTIICERLKYSAYPENVA